MNRRAFTLIELAAVTAAAGILFTLSQTAIQDARDKANMRKSEANLKEIGTAFAIYGVEWNDRQPTWINDSLASYGDSAAGAFAKYKAEVGEDHNSLVLGFDSNRKHYAFDDLNMNVPFNTDGSAKGTGSHRYPNAWAITQYMNEIFYDEVFFAPKDKIAIDAARVAGKQQANRQFNGANHVPTPGSYSISPAAMFNPAVSGYGTDPKENITYVDPWSMGAGMRSPTVSSAAFPELKTRLIEHHWLNGGDKSASANPGLTSGPYKGNQPYLFNQSGDSSPITLMFDGSIAMISVRDAAKANAKIVEQSGRALWSDQWTGMPNFHHDTALGDEADRTSFHIFTTDGIKGRDILKR